MSRNTESIRLITSLIWLSKLFYFLLVAVLTCFLRNDYTFDATQDPLNNLIFLFQNVLNKLLVSIETLLKYFFLCLTEDFHNNEIC